MYRILLATDGSQHALKAARYVASFCGALKEPAVTVLFVKELNVSMFAMPEQMAFPSGALDWNGIQESMEDAAQKALLETKEVLERGEVPVTLVTEIGKPADIICQFAQKEGFDLIAVGSRGLGGIAGLVLGSVSSQILHRSKVPVLVIH